MGGMGKVEIKMSWVEKFPKRNNWGEDDYSSEPERYFQTQWTMVQVLIFSVCTVKLSKISPDGTLIHHRLT